MAVDTYKESFNKKIAIGMLGTQLFVWDKIKKQLVYAVPITDDGGGEYGGDTESFEAPEADLARTPKIAGRQTLDDVTYISNYTADRYKRWKEILHPTEPNTFVEVYEDLSAHIVMGSGQFTARQGDPRTIEATVIPEGMGWVEDVTTITSAEYTEIASMFPGASSASDIAFDLTSIPANRVSPVREDSQAV